VSAPRPIVPGCFIFVTRRCAQREFLLRPDDETNNAFVYVLAEAAQRFDMQVVLSQMLSNHHHTLLYDPHGKQVEFREHFHKFSAKCQNSLRGRWENMWAAEETCVIEIITPEDLLEKLVYVATNPVKDDLVEKVHHWPGPNFVSALLNGKVMKASRPRHFFRDDGPMPASIELRLGVPDHFEGRERLLAELRRRIGEAEVQCGEKRRAEGRSVLGRRRVLRQSPFSRPESHEPRRNMRPRVACRSKWQRIAALQRNKEWQAEYRDARERWKAGEPAVFPYGTYWLRRHAAVQVAPPPEPN
jgi:putative transposase